MFGEFVQDASLPNIFALLSACCLRDLIRRFAPPVPCAGRHCGPANSRPYEGVGRGRFVNRPYGGEERAIRESPLRRGGAGRIVGATCGRLINRDKQKGGRPMAVPTARRDTRRRDEHCSSASVQSPPPRGSQRSPAQSLPCLKGGAPVYTLGRGDTFFLTVLNGAGEGFRIPQSPSPSSVSFADSSSAGEPRAAAHKNTNRAQG